MVKDKDKIEEEKETPEEEETTLEEVKVVSLVKIPTEYGLAFSTPEGDMSQMEYLVWLGNMFLEFKAGIVGSK